LFAVSPHASHCPAHALSQHTPSTQLSVMQSSFTLQVSPRLVLQTPAELHVRVPLHRSSSTPITFTHAPPPPVHASQAPQAATMQHRMSTQWPVMQSPSAAQVWPGLALHAPAASHVALAPQELGSSTFVTLTQVPLAPVQVSQLPQLAAPQQRWSTQCAEVHSLSAAHAIPFAILG
jgi:hypothetical protein